MARWRRDPLHAKLARQGKLALERGTTEPPRPPWDKAGIHGLARARRWDAVVTVSAHDMPGDDLAFVALGDGTLLVDGDAPVDDVTPLAEAVQQVLDGAYRAEAVRRTTELWAVAARSIDVVQLPPGTPGDAITISVRRDERTTIVDGAEWLASFPMLEALAGERGLYDYVLEAHRLQGDAWEVQISPL